MYKAGCAKYILSNEDDIQCLAKKKLEGLIQWGELRIVEDVQKKAWRRGGEHAYRRIRIPIRDNFEKSRNEPSRARFSMSDIICSQGFLEKPHAGQFNFSHIALVGFGRKRFSF